ncbi:hypothetical protein ACFU99_39740 [Streptomyces sp. NPDC057654]|uniref:hypothetical protein n=1 Tax=Streptomyces sp. NPDC057654 TaxID=3346196 RepID=UPI0036855916
MPVDPTDPETFDEYADDYTGGGDSGGASGASEIGVEAPEADTAEQQTDLTQRRDEPMTGADLDAADPGDVAEQARVVETDEDDYR